MKSRLKAECEKQRTERIPLLDAGLRGDVAASELEVGRLVVAPLCPARECWYFVPTLFQKLLPVQSIKGVGKIDFDKNCIWPVGIAFAPLAGCVKTNLFRKAERRRSGRGTDLLWPRFGSVHRGILQ